MAPPKEPKPPAILGHFTGQKDIDTCTFDDTLDHSKLRNDGVHVKDACLENNVFESIQDYEVESYYPDKRIYEFTDKNNVTWYANGFQWKPTSSGEIFNTYDYMVAVGKDLQDEFPAGSLINITYDDKSIIAKVVDRKPESNNTAPELKNESIDLSKATAFALGGYELLQKGIIHPITIERVRLRCYDTYNAGLEFNNPLAHCQAKNLFLSVQTAFYKHADHGQKAPPNPSPDKYTSILKSYFDIIPTVAALTTTLSPEYFENAGFYPPMPVFTIIHQNNVQTGDTTLYIDFRIQGFSSFSERDVYKQALKTLFPNLNVVEGESDWLELRNNNTNPPILVPKPYHKNDPTQLDPGEKKPEKPQQKKKVQPPPPKKRPTLQTPASGKGSKFKK